MGDSSNFDVVSELIDIYIIQKARCNELLDSEKDLKVKTKETRENIALLAMILGRIADEIGTKHQKTIQQRKDQTFGTEKDLERIATG